MGDGAVVGWWSFTFVLTGEDIPSSWLNIIFDAVLATLKASRCVVSQELGASRLCRCTARRGSCARAHNQGVAQPGLHRKPLASPTHAAWCTR